MKCVREFVSVPGSVYLYLPVAGLITHMLLQYKVNFTTIKTP